MIVLRLGQQRRGGTTTSAVLALAAMLITIGVELDAGRLFVTRHKDQVIADAATMAAAYRLPRQDEARAAAQRVVTAYEAMYNRNFTLDLQFQTNPSGW